MNNTYRFIFLFIFAVIFNQSIHSQIMHLAWEQKSGSSSKIMYYKIVDQMGGPLKFEDYSEISELSGYTKNYQPSIISNQNDVRVCWIGRRPWSDEPLEGEVPEEGDGSGGSLPIGETKVFLEAKLIICGLHLILTEGT